MIALARGTTDPARPNYLSHFALREPPFAPAADSRFFYADPARQQCLNLLQHLAEYSEEWLLVAGEPGVGKSTLLNEFVSRADPHVKPCRIGGAQVTDGGQLFLQIAQCFGVELAGQADPLDALRQHLNALHAEQVPVVAVDDAERLAEDALEIVLRLADLAGDHGKLVRVVLFGPSELQQRLKAPRFSGLSQPHVMELRPFDEGHTGLYLAHRLSVAGFEGPNPFEIKAIKQIHREAAGLPARINHSAHQFLRERMAGEKSKAGTWVRRIAVPAAALAAVGTFGFMIQEYLVGVTEPALSANESQPALPASAMSHGEPKPVTVAVPPPAAPLATRPLVLREGESVQVSCSPLEGSGRTESAPEASPAVTSSPTAAHVPAPVQATAAVMVPLATARAEPSPNSEAGKGVEAQNDGAPGEPASASMPATTPKPIEAEKSTAPASGSAWVAAQQADQFTLQLLAAEQAATVREFIRRQRVKEPHAIVETTRNGTPLHLLVSGAYGSREAALAAAGKLPKGIQAWPRSFGELQKVPPPAKATAAPAPAKGRDFKDAAWLRERNPRHYTLQLVSAEHEQALWNHLGSTSLAGPLALVATTKEGKPWYLLLYGDFADRAAALQAVSTLPARLRRGEPWPREFGAVQGMPPAPKKP